MATNSKKKYWEGIGRRKTSTARVRVFKGKSSSTINGKPVEDIYKSEMDQSAIYKPLIVTGNKTKLYFSALTKGGGVKGQRGAVVLGLARAILGCDESTAKELRKEKLLTRDSREKERKKYFFKKARKRPQFSKR